MLNNIAREAENLFDRVCNLRNQLLNSVFEEYEKELIAIRNDYTSLSAEIFFHKEITECIVLLTKQNNYLPGTPARSITIKTRSLANYLSEIGSTLQVCEKEHLIKKATKSLSQKDYRKSLNYCKQVLSKEPWNKKTLDLLNILTNKTPSGIKAEVHDCLEKYKFLYLHSIGKGVLSSPQDINVTPDGTILFVSDHKDKAVHRFTTEGKYLGKCNINATKPRGIFNGTGKEVWVCDIDGQKITSVDYEGKKLNEIFLPEYLGNSFPTTYPCWGINMDGEIALILTDHQKQNFSLAALYKNGSIAIARPSLNDFGIPCGIGLNFKDLWIGSMSHGCLYCHTNENNFFLPFNARFQGLKLKAFTFTKNYIFLNFGRFLKKVTYSGTLIYSLDMRDYIHPHILNSGIAVMERAGKNILFTPDGKNQCIHAISI